ncbi:MAG: hypothetical protein ABW215_17100 [Kibdelosporangium sp.]
MRPLPWPDPEPEPAPGESALFDQVDWLTFSHDQLYEMVHNGIDVAGATAIAAKWARLGEALREIGDELSGALAASLDAWEGEAAEQARAGIAALSQWSQDSGSTAIDVSGCVSTAALNADVARRNMPEPLAGPHVPIPIGPDDNAFRFAPEIVKDPHGSSQEQQAAHQEAARVMQQFQVDSRAVYGTVPQFSPPSVRRLLTENPPIPTPPPVPTPPVPTSPPPTPAPVLGPAPVASPTPATPAVADGRPAPATPVTSQPLAQPSEPKPMSPAPATAQDSTPPAAPRPVGAGGAAGAPPMMGGMAGGQGGEDQERKSPKYLEGDPGIWRITDRLAPPVIGEDEQGA